ncbi:hypothetical protein RCL_jg26940.t1 [Rhizophagus clarus]|uniref:Uncharacterized protein n=1 Tax=Rhizophagus clarus TaxID=94130 RepID=A0A8H3LMP5_9GLOM|nr:hypothetical protein RCL_jg26940.t1 [Rhizophagus clarus]
MKFYIIICLVITSVLAFGPKEKQKVIVMTSFSAHNCRLDFGQQSALKSKVLEYEKTNPKTFETHGFGWWGSLIGDICSAVAATLKFV